MKKYPKVLVAAPTHESKNYCIYEWMENVAKFRTTRQLPKTLSGLMKHLELRWVGKIQKEKECMKRLQMGIMIAENMLWMETLTIYFT